MWHLSATSNGLPSSPKQSIVPSDQVQSLAPPRQRILSPRSTLVEALRTNPFGTHGANETMSMKTSQPEDPVDSLNHDLRVFADVYPDVKIEVLRELLTRFDGDSRLELCTEQLVKYKDEWAKGRLLSPPRTLGEVIPVDELFRSKAYCVASKRALSAEFKALNKSAVDAVLAEVNHSYSKARPVLHGVAARTWRSTITSLFKKRRALNEPSSFLIAEKGRSSERRLNSTGNAELDQELEELFFLPVRRQQAEARTIADRELATALNQQEAEKANALFECQCCYNDVPFEQITTCTNSAHIICKVCAHRSLNEALFGQGWAKSIDASLGTLKCLAPSTSEECPGHIPPSLFENAIFETKSGQELWTKFEQRLASDNLTRSNITLLHCPFCTYAESPTERTLATAGKIPWRFRLRLPDFDTQAFLILLLLELLLPSLLLLYLIISFVSPQTATHYFHNSLLRVQTTNRTKIFTCRHPSCGKRSCLTCHKPWHDPHTCHEPLILSLRTTVEAARTTALKRTCPRCGTSFVKSSGCNKLTCVCGYAMCYLCRKNIGRVMSVADFLPGAIGWNNNNNNRNRNRQAINEENAAIAAAGEGYRHFCEHFRPVAGMKCTECDKCDLYKTEDEDAIVRKAGEDAEREWRIQHARELDAYGDGSGLRDDQVKGLEDAVSEFNGRDGQGCWLNFLYFLTDSYTKIKDGRWSLQSTVDWAVSRCVVVDDG